MTERSSQCPWSDTAPAYALGALSAEEARRFETHLTGCEACRADIAALAPAVETVGASVEQLEAPPQLRSRVIAQVHAEAELLRAAGPEADLAMRESPRRRRRRARWLQLSPAPAAGAATALVAIGALGGVLGSRDHSASPRIVAAQIARAAAPNARAELVIAGEFATLRLRSMPPPPPGHVYQVWLRLPGRSQPQPTNVLFSVRTDGSATVAVPRRPTGAREVLVTAEPSGGSRRPTSQPILAARLS